MSSNAKQDKQIRAELDLTQPTVSKWRNRWLKNEEKLLLIDAAEKGIQYLRKILGILSDDPRPGALSTFTAEQVCQIMENQPD